MIHTFYFSPSGTTKATVNLLIDALATECTHHDITVKSADMALSPSDDVAVIAAPVYGGRVPELAAQRLSGVKGTGHRAIVIVVYGNRDYDDALLELCDIAQRQGFEVVAAGAFIGEHCIFPKVAANRPDSEDNTQIDEFAKTVKAALTKDSRLNLEKLKGKRPYKKIASVPLHPKVEMTLCNGCGVCARECPAGAIPANNPRTTDGSKCITCCRCIGICPKHARSLGGLLYKIAGWKFVKDNTPRRDAEWYI